MDKRKNSVKDNFADLLLLDDLLMCIFQISYQCPSAMADVDGGGKGIENAMAPPPSVVISTSEASPGRQDASLQGMLIGSAALAVVFFAPGRQFWDLRGRFNPRDDFRVVGNPYPRPTQNGLELEW